VLFYWFLFLQAAELVIFFCEGVQGIAVDEPSVFLIVGLLVISIFFLMVSCLLGFHSFLTFANITTWEHMSWRRITYLKHLREDSGSPFTRSVPGNVAAYCCGPYWCPASCRRVAALRYDEGGGIIWELGEQRQNCCLRLCVDWCGC